MMNVYTRYEYIETFSVITLVNHGLSDEITFKEIALRQTKEVNIQTAVWNNVVCHAWRNSGTK